MVSVEEENSVTKVQFGFLLTSSGAPPVVITWRGAQWRMWHSRLLSEQMFLQTRNVLKLYISLGSVLCFISWQSCAQLRLALGTKTMWRGFGKYHVLAWKTCFGRHIHGWRRPETSSKIPSLSAQNMAGNCTSLLYKYPVVSIIQVL